MKNTKIFAAFLIILVFTAGAHAIPPQQRKVGDTWVKAGISTKNIMPLLVTIADRQGKYLSSVQGKYRSCYITIDLKPRAATGNVDELERVAKKVVDTVTSFYPSCGGEVKLKAPGSDSFHFVFEKGKITEDKSIRGKDN